LDELWHRGRACLGAQLNGDRDPGRSGKARCRCTSEKCPTGAIPAPLTDLHSRPQLFAEHIMLAKTIDFILTAIALIGDALSVRARRSR
jgi:hypothetical protein